MRTIDSKVHPVTYHTAERRQGVNLYTDEQFAAEYKRFKDAPKEALTLITRKLGLQPTWKLSAEQEARLAAARVLIIERKRRK